MKQLIELLRTAIAFLIVAALFAVVSQLRK